MVRILNNPYGVVDFDTVEYHYSQFHLHDRYLGDPADVADLFAGEGTDAEGNHLPDGDEHTLFGIGDKASLGMRWPWTEFNELDDDYDNRDPEEMGVVAVPAAEQIDSEHIVSFFTSFDADAGWRRNGTISRVTNQTDEFVPESNGGLCYHAHPLRYTDKPDGGPCCGDAEDDEEEDEDTPQRYHKDFAWWSREDGLLGTEVFRRGIDAQDLWDKLLCSFLPDRQIWAFAADDTNDPQVVGDRVARSTMTVLMSGGSFDPSNQIGSMEAAADAYREGRFFAHRRDGWNVDEEKAPTYPVISDISVNGLKITVTAEGYDTIEWISKGDVVDTGDSIKVKNEHYPYVRVRVATNSGAETITQPFTVEGDADVAEFGDIDLGQIDIGRDNT